MTGVSALRDEGGGGCQKRYSMKAAPYCQVASTDGSGEAGARSGKVEERCNRWAGVTKQTSGSGNHPGASFQYRALPVGAISLSQRAGDPDAD